jgi:hypothetical protein
MEMRMSQREEGAGLSPRLLAFLSGDDEDLGGDDEHSPLAVRQLFVEEDTRAAVKSRLVAAGGVRFLRSESYRLTADDLEPMAQRREGISGIRLQLVKFYFTFTELPPNRSYAEVRVRINLNPPVPVLQLRPFLKHAGSEPAGSFSTEFHPMLGKLRQVEVRRGASGGISRTGQAPAVTALDLGPDGFGWTYQARDGAPLFPRTEHAVAVLELPIGTQRLTGWFDAEAIITHRILRTFVSSEAIPGSPPAAFEITL